MNRRVVITGIGPVTSIGNGKNQFWKALLDKEVRVKKHENREGIEYNFRTDYVVPCAEIDEERFSDLRKLRNKASKGSVLCAYSAMLAVEDAEIDKKDIPEDCSVIIGTGFTNSHDAVKFTRAYAEDGQFNRTLIPIAMPNAPAAWISILFGTHGSTYTINTACASGSDAIGHAYNQIVCGRSSMSICGGIDVVEDELDISLRGFDCLTVLTKSNDGMPRPFCKERSGFLFNEGAACSLVLEELEHAINRKAKIYAEITGYASNSDAYNIVMMPTNGAYEKKVIEELLRKVDHLDYYNAHGTATVLNDNTEATIIQELFGESCLQQPIINSTKGLVGHSIGASGALEAAVCALTIESGKIHGNITGNFIENLNITECIVEREVSTALSASFGFGGHNSALLFLNYKY